MAKGHKLRRCHLTVVQQPGGWVSVSAKINKQVEVRKYQTTTAEAKAEFLKEFPHS